MSQANLNSDSTAPHPGRNSNAAPRNTPVQLHADSGVPHGHVPAYLPGSASLVEELDQPVLVVLRDGKHLVGVSFKRRLFIFLERNTFRLDRMAQPRSRSLSFCCLVKTLCSYDQYSNLVLGDAVERRIVVEDGRTLYTDIPLGLYVVRGDTVVILGQIPSTATPQWMQPVTVEEINERMEQTKESSLQWDFDNDLIA
jgi:U6 snRNA-associated Sm-like protein LSm1